MPKKLLGKNRRELLRWSGFKPEEVVILDGTAQQIEKKLASGAKVFLMGFRRFALSWMKLPRDVKALHTDEHHKGFKGPDSAQTLAMYDFMDRQGEWFVPMTGTLVNGPLDSVYPAIRVINANYYLSHDAFMAQHAVEDFDGKVIGWKNHQKLSTILGTHGIRRTFASIYGEQEIVTQPVVVEMTPPQRALYDKFEKDAVLELEKFFLDGTKPGVGFIRARQLMEHPNHFPDLTDPGKFVDVMKGDTPEKENVLDNILEEHSRTGKPIIIYSPMRPQQARIELLLQAHGIPYGVINGDTSQKAGDLIDVAFQEGRLKAILASPACADVGFNWQFCGDQEVDHIVFMCLDYLDTTYTQAVRRAIRQKRTCPLRVTILEYHLSIDQKVAWIVWAKSVEANKVDPSRAVLQLSRFEGEKMAA